MDRFRDAACGRLLEICPGVRLTLHDAGHIVGSAMPALDLGGRG